MDTKGAFLDYTFRPQGNLWVEILLHRFRPVVMEPVHISHAVGTTGNAVLAADAPIIVDQHEALLVHVGCTDWTNLDARRILTVKTRSGDELCPEVRVLSFYLSQYIVPRDRTVSQ
jgi:hypothetical protein